MSYSLLFDGEEHWLDVDCEPGWRKPYMQVTDVVELDPQLVKHDHLESPLTNLVSSPVEFPVESAWGIERGWSAMAVMLQQIGELMSPPGDNQIVVEQLVVRDEKAWKVKSTHYRVLWKGDDVEC